jgi:hypothetical protein
VSIERAFWWAGRVAGAAVGVVHWLICSCGSRLNHGQGLDDDDYPEQGVEYCSEGCCKFHIVNGRRYFGDA